MWEKITQLSSVDARTNKKYILKNVKIEVNTQHAVSVW